MLLLFVGIGVVQGITGGDTIVGGTFSRRRWHDMREAERLEREKAERAERDEKLRVRAERRRRAAETAAERERARIEAKTQGDAVAVQLAQQHAQAAARGVETLRQIAALASAQQAAAHGAVPAHDDDEDALLALILAMQHGG